MPLGPDVATFKMRNDGMVKAGSCHCLMQSVDDKTDLTFSLFIDTFLLVAGGSFFLCGKRGPGGGRDFCSL